MKVIDPPKPIITAKIVSKMQDKMDWSERDCQFFTQTMREELGASSVEAYEELIKMFGEGVKKFFDVCEVEMEIHLKEKGEKIRTELQMRSLVYCNDIEGFKAYIRTERKIDPNDEYEIKIGIDGGGDHFKGKCLLRVMRNGWFRMHPNLEINYQVAIVSSWPVPIQYGANCVQLLTE